NAIPFHEAAGIGTGKVIREHSTIGLVVTTDGSFGELPRENFLEAEERTVAELKKQGKPFLILLNSQFPHKDETQRLAEKIRNKYGVSVVPVSCEQLRKEDITRILEQVLYEFPVSEIRFYIPKWVEMLPVDHELKSQIIGRIRELMKTLVHIKDVTKEAVKIDGPYVQDTLLDEVNLSDGVVRVRLQIRDEYYYQILSELCGVPMESEYDLIHTMKELAQIREEYVKVKPALESVKGSGYGVVVPELEEIQIEDPSVIRQGNKFGVKIRSKSPSVHMIKANIETEIAPIVGTEQQAEDLIRYIQESGDRGESIWETNIFGKSIEQLVQDGIRNKIAAIGEESQAKLQDTMQKIVNDTRGGLVCIII
ncbi:MAG TPA: stage IV sporulation protein A, partial [Candidatus Blautia excrementigallinarum]|nr:stage IV sporulation protein A [Candidatus Blautia excrementigallinarum]